jgi:hypothetical protein
MSRFSKVLLALLSLAGFLVTASATLAADKLECALTQNGVKTTKLVGSKEECAKLSGKIVEHTSKPKTQ